MKDQPKVSIIVPTFNSEKYLEKCLKSIKNQTYKNIEVIVVDNYSKDKTIDIAKSYADLVLFIGPERSSQINFGVKHASGKYVYRVDSDFVLDSVVVDEAVTKCECSGFDAICVQNVSDSTVSFWSRVRKLERDCYADDELNIAAGFMKKNVFEALNGFDEDLIAGEDYDLHNRILKKGYIISRVQSRELHLGEPKTLEEIARKHYYYGKTFSKFVKKQEENSGQLSPLRPAFAKHWKDFVKQPDVAIGFAIYQYVRYFSAGIGYLVGN